MIKTLIQLFNDWKTLHFKKPPRVRQGFAFLIHLRDIHDLYRKFPALKHLPKNLVEILTPFLPPVTTSTVTGLRNKITGELIEGWIIGIPLTAKQMLNNRNLALRKIKRAVKLSEHKGAGVIGLGALTASLSRGGLDLQDKVKIPITTGHAYTIHNVTETLLAIMRALTTVPKDSTLAIVGAGGSIGSGCAKLLTRESFQKVILIDTKRRNEHLSNLSKNLLKSYPECSIVESHTIDDIKEADFILTATNAPEALVKAEHLKPGAVVVDDAQPSDIDESVFLRKDVLVLEAGAVRTPGILSNFNIDLKHPEDNFSCMAELLILASQECSEYHGLGVTELSQIDEIAQRGKEAGFSIAEFQNKNEKISPEKIAYIKQVRGK